jgi:hypothetical protein
VEFWLSRSLFTNFSFTQWNPQNARFGGKTLFIYITKSIYIGSTSLRTLPLDLEPPLQGKEHGPPYSNENAEKEANVFVFLECKLAILECKLAKKENTLKQIYLTLEFSRVVPFQAVSIPRIW